MPPLPFLCFLFLVVSASDSQAKQFHVDVAAKDIGDGSLEKPFATVQQAADIMKPGDVCLVREGVYRETVRPKDSGTAEAPLVFRAFPGETAVLSGCAPATGWTQEEGNLYSAAVPIRLGRENQEFASRKMLFEARWPNAGKSVPEGLLEFNTAAMDTGTTPTKIVDDALPQVDFAGVHVWVSTFKRWYCWTGAVSAKAEGAIEIEDNSDSKENHICKPGGDYCLFAVLQQHRVRCQVELSAHVGGRASEGPLRLSAGQQPGASYELMAMFRVTQGAVARLRVEGYGGPGLASEPISSGAPRWKLATLRFTVAADRTSAEVILEKSSDDDALVHVDDPGLQLVK